VFPDLDNKIYINALCVIFVVLLLIYDRYEAVVLYCVGL